MRERESVERGTLCSFRRGRVSMWEGIAGREVDRYQQQKEWTERPRGLVLIPEDCFNSGEVYRGEIPTSREPEALRVNWKTAAEVPGTLGSIPE